MKAYMYNKENNRFVGVYNCQLDPVESRKQNKEVCLLPADATWVQPPVQLLYGDIVSNDKQVTYKTYGYWNGTDWEVKVEQVEQVE